MEEKNIWTVLAKILAELKFSPSEIEKVRTDILNLISSETVAVLLEQLSPEDRASLQTELESVHDDQKNKFVADKMKTLYSQEQIADQLQKSTGIVVKDYLDNLFKKMDDSKKKQLLQEFT